MILTNKIQNIAFDSTCIYLTVNGKEYKIELAVISNKLLKASNSERNFYKISPSGYGIHWPLIDEDLSIEALLKQNKLH